MVAELGTGRAVAGRWGLGGCPGKAVLPGDLTPLPSHQLIFVVF